MEHIKQKIDNLLQQKKIEDYDTAARIKKFLDPGYGEDNAKIIEKLINSEDYNSLNERFFKELEFGTGGLRGKMGVGTNYMNEYNISRATQGLANYIKSFKNKMYKNGVVISYDSRNNSRHFAIIAARVLTANKIPVYIFKEMRPTPILSFSVREKKAAAGIMVTASHNPAEYNGYKVYFSDGGQIVSPHDKNIIDRVNKIKSYNQIKKIDLEDADENGLLEWIDTEIDEKYKEYLNVLLDTRLLKTHGESIKIVYTPLHGTGGTIIPKMMKEFGVMNVFSEPAQSIPDGNFPTCPKPNPEYSETLKLSIELGKEIDGDIIIATDPDADRTGIAVKDKSGEYILLNGNEIASCLTHYRINSLKTNNELVGNNVIIKTVVTTDLISEIAAKNNVPVCETLTGFKYIGEKLFLYENKAINRYNNELKSEGSDILLGFSELNPKLQEEVMQKYARNYIFGGEESYGYSAGVFVRDKDAIISSLLVASMAISLKKNNKTILDLLDEIYAEYGVYAEGLLNIQFEGVDGNKKMKSIMKELHTKPFKTILDKNVIKVVDYKTDDIKDIDNKSLPKSDVVSFLLEDKTKIVVRPSGTEPKIKIYFLTHKNTEPDKIPETKNKLNDYIEKLKSFFNDKF